MPFLNLEQPRINPTRSCRGLIVEWVGEDSFSCFANCYKYHSQSLLFLFSLFSFQKIIKFEEFTAQTQTNSKEQLQIADHRSWVYLILQTYYRQKFRSERIKNDFGCCTHKFMVAALGCANDHSTIDEIDHTTGISHSVGTTR